MKTITENIKQYVAVWNEQTPERIKAVLQECCVANVSYIDRNTPAFSGIDLFVELIMQSYVIAPGRTIDLQSEPECFEGHAYYRWGIQIPGVGDKIGRDYVTYNEAGLIVSIVGFLPLA